VLLAVVVLLTGLLAPVTVAAQDATPGIATPTVDIGTPVPTEVTTEGASTPVPVEPGATPDQVASPAASPVAEAAAGQVDLDVLFIGAHPDDEASRLSTYGQWEEFEGLEVGVITITRGEGGGNAVGTEEGPALGLLREAEEREAVGMAGIEHIYNLDKVDYYYTVSAPLTEETWGYDDTLSRVVRVVRETKPEIIITMNPAPTPGNHGHHQMAGRFAVAAYDAAGNPDIYPEQVTAEGLEAWSPSKLFTTPFYRDAPTGEDCVTGATPADETETVYGVWAGTASEVNDGKTWAQVEQEARRVYASQGWAGFADAPTDPAEIGCDYFLLIDSRVPFTVDATGSDGMLEGAVSSTTGGLPAGTTFDVETAAFDVIPGQPFDVAVTAVTAGTDVSVGYTLPDGWTAEVTSSSVEGGTLQEVVAITPSADADPATRYSVIATLTVDGATGQNVEVVEAAPPVEGHLEALPQVAQFRDWVAEVNQPVLDSLIKPVVSMGVGETRDVNVIVTNNTATEQDTSVTLLLPEGLTVDAKSQAVTLGPSETTTVTFTITNEDTTLPTSVEGGVGGDYLLDITTVAQGVATTEQAGLNLVPVTTVPAIGAAPVATPAVAPVTSAPTVDGTIAEGEYPGQPLDISRVWEGEEPESPADASGQAWLAWDENGIYVAVEVTDETKGTVLPDVDAKRHWRTDSVEIAIDPLGTAENTSGTFKVGVFAETQEGGPAAYRDADAFQGPVAETAPGFEVASSVTDPYTGYVIETFIPYDALPAPIDPDGLAMNIFIYDSDTEDLSGQTRLGWSVWGGVQGDPYRWGHVRLEGYTATDGGEVDAPQMPLDVAESVDSPWSIIQAAGDGVPLGGAPAVPESGEVSLAAGPTAGDGTLTATLQAGDTGGAVHAFAVDGTGAVLGEQEVTVDAGATVEIAIDVGDADPAGITFAASFQTDEGAVQAIAETVQP
jgi:LmbE family N-acetylglucosaminyl deacetylase